MFAQCAVRHTSLGEAVIIGGANIICRRQTSFKKRTFVLVDKSAFFVGGDDGNRTRVREPLNTTFFVGSLSFKIPAHRREQTRFGLR